jgi:RHS repeat-associated protein
MGGSNEPLDYMHARFYNGRWGRFLSVDPVLDLEHATRNPQGWNRYSYVENNPVNRTDPNGRCTNILSCAGWGIAGAGTATGLTIRLIAVASVMYMESRSTHVGDLKPAVIPQTLSEGLTWDVKIDKQLGKRGWDAASVHDTVNNPDKVLDATDRRGGKDAPAHAYLNPDGSYVIVNDATGEVVQVSHRNDPAWIPDSSIKEKDPPKPPEPKKPDEKPEPPL